MTKLTREYLIFTIGNIYGIADNEELTDVEKLEQIKGTSIKIYEKSLAERVGSNANIVITQEELKRARQELIYANSQRSDNFTALVYVLITKAQSTPSNRMKLIKSFPAEVYAWYEWQDRLDVIKNWISVEE